MPFWVIYHPEEIFQDVATKKALVDDITKYYTDVGLPPFYVVIKFIATKKEDFWVGAQNEFDKPTIRITIDHIAIHLPDDDEAYHRTTKGIDMRLKKHIADKGYNWEYHIDDTERRMWKVNGMNAPPHGSDEERVWFEKNHAEPWSGAYTIQRAAPLYTGKEMEKHKHKL